MLEKGITEIQFESILDIILENKMESLIQPILDSNFDKLLLMMSCIKNREMDLFEKISKEEIKSRKNFKSK